MRARKQEAFSYRRLMRDQIWKPIHSALKTTVRATYLNKYYEIGATKSAIQGLGLVATTLHLYGQDGAMNLENELSTYLRDAVFEKDVNGEYTDKARNAQTEVFTMFDYLNRSDPTGEYEAKAVQLINKYTNGAKENGLLLMNEIKTLTETLSPWISMDSDKEKEEWEKTLKKVKKEHDELIGTP